MEKIFKLIECAIVTAAKNHNPTILNPDFLKRNKIVFEEGWEAEKILTTDVFSQVGFKNGFVITVDPQKIVFTDNGPSRSISKPLLPSLDEIAIKYIDTLPHVKYSAVGVNFKAVVPFESQEESESFVRDKVISSGPWKEFAGGIKSAILKFVYPIASGTLNISMEPATFQEKAGQSEQKNVMLISANFHRDISIDSDEAIEKMKETIEGWKNDRDNFFEMINLFFKDGR